MTLCIGRFVTWEGFRTRTEALLWSTCSKILRRSQQLSLLTLEKDCQLAGTQLGGLQSAHQDS